MEYTNIVKRSLEKSGINNGNSIVLLENLLTLKSGNKRRNNCSQALTVLCVPMMWNYQKAEGHIGTHEILENIRNIPNRNYLKENLRPIISDAEQHADKFYSKTVSSLDVISALAESDGREYRGAKFLQELGFSGEKIDLCNGLLSIASAF